MSHGFIRQACSNMSCGNISLCINVHNKGEVRLCVSVCAYVRVCACASESADIGHACPTLIGCAVVKQVSRRKHLLLAFPEQLIKADLEIPLSFVTWHGPLNSQPQSLNVLVCQMHAGNKQSAQKLQRCVLSSMRVGLLTDTMWKIWQQHVLCL